MTVPLIERFPRPETYRNVLQTTLSAAVATTTRPVTVTPATTAGWPTSPGFRIGIDSELLLVTYVANDGLSWLAETVEGTTAATHSSGATVTQVLTAGALAQAVTDHRAVGSPSADPHPMYVRKGATQFSSDYNLVGDGVTDDTNALQNAIDAMFATGGGTVWLKPGTYMIRGVTLKTGVYLRGAGFGNTMLKLIAGANQPIVTLYSSPDAVISNAFNCGVIDLRLDGNRFYQSSPNAHGILCVTNPLYTKATNDLDQDIHHLFENVHITNTAGDGVHMDGRGEARLINVHVLFAQGYGFTMGNDSFLSFCTAGQTAKAGFASVNSGSGRLVGCKAFYCGRLMDQGWYAGNTLAPGFWFANCFSLSLVDCEAQDCSGQGFFLEGSHRMTMAGCVADSNSFAGPGFFGGFHLYNSDYNTIAGCIAFERKADGVTNYQIYALKLDGGDDHNDITMTHSASQWPQVASVSTALFPGSVITSSSVRINGSDVGLQIPAYVTPFTPDQYSGQFIEMTLTGAITVNNPASPYPGQLLTFIFVQDATGGRVVTWGSAFKVTWTPTTTANRINTISFVYDGTRWVQTSTGINIPP